MAAREPLIRAARHSSPIRPITCSTRSERAWDDTTSERLSGEASPRPTGPASVVLSDGSEAGRHRVVQIEPRLLPVALHGPLGHAAHRRDLGKRESAEELQVDALG